LNRRIETTALRRDGREFPVELSISPAGGGDTYLFGAFIRDLSARKEAEAALHQQTSLVKLLQEVATAANLAPNSEHALQTGVDQICAYTGWPVGHAYVLANDGTGDLLPTRIWPSTSRNASSAFAWRQRRPGCPQASDCPAAFWLRGRRHGSWT
jgi:hypothetical protein